MVTVVASSIKKNATGPKVGSIGFVDNVRDYELCTFSGRSFLLTESVITFIHFGSEKDSRNEKKHVFVLFPCSSTVESNYSVEDLSKLVQDAKFCENVRSNWGHNRPLIMTTPLNKSASDMDYSEKCAMVDCKLNQTLGDFLSRYMGREYYNNSDEPMLRTHDVLHRFYNACFDTESRKALINQYKNNIEDLMHSLDMYNAAFQRYRKSNGNNVTLLTTRVINDATAIIRNGGSSHNYDLFARNVIPLTYISVEIATRLVNLEEKVKGSEIKMSAIQARRYLKHIKDLDMLRQ